MNSHVYVLGNRIYHLQSRNEKILSLLNKLLPSYERSQASNSIEVQEETINLDGPLAIRGLDETLFASDDPFIALVSLLDRALAAHAGYLWIDASALLTPQGSLVLLSGPSHSGKTTLTLSMVLAHSWKILAEDIVLIDLQTRSLVPFARPLSLRPDTADRVKQATGLTANSFMIDGWLSNKDWYSLKPVPANFNFALDLAFTDPNASVSFKFRQVQIGEFLRSLITHSNALHYDLGINKLSESLKETTLCLVSGGSLTERIKSLLKLTGC